MKRECRVQTQFSLPGPPAPLSPGTGGGGEIVQKPWEPRALARQPRCVVLDSMEGSTCDCFLNFFFFLVSHSCHTTFRSGFFLRFYLGSGFWVLTRPVPSGLALVFCMLATLSEAQMTHG